MTDKQYLDAVIRHRIKVTPVLARAKNHKIVVEKWFAGFVTLTTDNWTNIVKPNDFTFGDSPHKAIETLLEKKKISL